MDIKKMNPMVKRTLSLLMAVSIVLTSAVVPGISGFEAYAATADASWVEENGKLYLDMKDNLTIDSKTDMYNLLTTKFSEPETSMEVGTSAAQKIYKLDNSIALNSSGVVNGSNSFELAQREYEVYRGYNQRKAAF